MALHTQFHRKLDQLWKRQTENLRSLIKPKYGKLLAFTRKTRNRLIAELLELATDVLLRRSARRSFRETYEKRRLFHLQGHGRVARGESLVTFARSLSGSIVYAFWKGKHCLYVARGRRRAGSCRIGSRTGAKPTPLRCTSSARRATYREPSVWRRTCLTPAISRFALPAQLGARSARSVRNMTRSGASCSDCSRCADVREAAAVGSPSHGSWARVGSQPTLRPAHQTS